MAQSESPRARRIFRWTLIVVGSVVAAGLAAIVGVAVWRAAMRSDEFLEKLLLSVVDKAALALGVAFVGYWLQQRLEVFKRNQALASELAKARIAAYHRMFAAVSSLEYAGHRVLHAVKEVVAEGSGEKKAAKQVEVDAHINAFVDEFVKFTSMLAAERHLVGDAFCKAAVRFIEQVQLDVRNSVDNGPPSDAAAVTRSNERIRLREEIALCLPPFARVPVEDLYLSAPDVGRAVAGMAKNRPKK
jgi:hypothetical protein